MGIGVTVIFGTIRTTAAQSRMAACSGPPPSRWEQACGPVSFGRGRADARASERKLIDERTSKGRGWTRRVRTFTCS